MYKDSMVRMRHWEMMAKEHSQVCLVISFIAIIAIILVFFFPAQN